MCFHRVHCVHPSPTHCLQHVNTLSGGKARVLLQRQMQRESRAAWQSGNLCQIHSGLCGLAEGASTFCQHCRTLRAPNSCLLGLATLCQSLRSTLPCFAARGCKNDQQIIFSRQFHLAKESQGWYLDSFSALLAEQKKSLPMRRVFLRTSSGTILFSIILLTSHSHSQPIRLK